MSRLARIGAVALFLSALTITTRLALPDRTLACSCRGPQPLVVYRDEPNLVIVVGTISMLGARGIVLELERVFKGPVPSLNLRLESGDQASCGVTFAGRARVFMVAPIDAGVAHPNGCLPFVTLPSAEGEALVAEAEATYGGVDPPPGTDAPAAPASSGDPALVLVLIASLGLAVGLFAIVWLVSRRGGRQA